MSQKKESPQHLQDVETIDDPQVAVTRAREALRRAVDLPACPERSQLLERHLAFVDRAATLRFGAALFAVPAVAETSTASTDNKKSKK